MNHSRAHSKDFDIPVGQRPPVKSAPLSRETTAGMAANRVALSRESDVEMVLPSWVVRGLAPQVELRQAKGCGLSLVSQRRRGTIVSAVCAVPLPEAPPRAEPRELYEHKCR